MSAVDIDRAAFGALCAINTSDGRPLAAQLLEIFEHDTPPLVSQLRAEAAAAHSAELLRLAHKLKGSALTMGALSVTAICQQIERCVREGQLAEVMALVDAVELTTVETMRLLHEELARPAGGAV